MEESEKRRARLRAMRMEAQEIVSNTNCSSPSMPPPQLGSEHLSNPLLEPSSMADDPATTAPRFGFYTDPMAAFSADKGQNSYSSSRGGVSPNPRAPFPPSPGPRNTEMPLSGVQQFQSNYSPYQRMHQAGDPHYSAGPTTSPIGIRSPYLVHQGCPNFKNAQGRGNWFNNSPSPGSGHGGSPYSMYQGSPNFRTPPQGRGRWFNNSRSPGPGRGGGTSPGPGRGKGPWDGNRTSPGYRHSGGRGRGSHVDFQARSFYDKSMLVDPWESLNPVIWQGDKASRSWSILSSRKSIQETPGAKKPRVSDFGLSSSKQSLAEFLAASLDEAVGDASV